MKTLLFKSPRPVIIMIFLIVAGLLGWAFFTPSLTQSHLYGHTMGTEYSVKYRHPEDGFTPGAAQKQIESMLDEINRTMSTYDPESELSRLNRAATIDWMPVSESLFTVLEAAITIGRQSGGAFDITVGPLVNLWGFGPEFRPEQVPDEDDITAMLLKVGQDKLVLDRETLTIRKTRPDVYIDLSAIAKGYAVDRLAEMFDSQGIEHYFIEIGGEIRARGTNAQNIAWRVGIEKPYRHGRTAIHKILSLNNTGLATSGDYQNFFEIEDHRYSHLIDPATGWPVKNGTSSVTVLAESCMLADAWTTALLVLGHERGLAVAEAQGLPALFIVSQDGIVNEYTSSHFPAEHSTSGFTLIFLAAFLVIGFSLIAMAIGVLSGRQPLAGSCGGLGRMGLGCEAGCEQSCIKQDSKTMAKSGDPNRIG